MNLGQWAEVVGLGAVAVGILGTLIAIAVGLSQLSLRSRLQKTITFCEDTAAREPNEHRKAALNRIALRSSASLVASHLVPTRYFLEAAWWATYVVVLLLVIEFHQLPTQNLPVSRVLNGGMESKQTDCPPIGYITGMQDNATRNSMLLLMAMVPALVSAVGLGLLIGNWLNPATLNLHDASQAKFFTIASGMAAEGLVTALVLISMSIKKVKQPDKVRDYQGQG